MYDPGYARIQITYGCKLSDIHTTHFSHLKVQRQEKSAAIAFLLALQSSYSFAVLVDMNYTIFFEWRNCGLTATLMRDTSMNQLFSFSKHMKNLHRIKSCTQAYNHAHLIV